MDIVMGFVTGVACGWGVPPLVKYVWRCYNFNKIIEGAVIVLTLILVVTSTFGAWYLLCLYLGGT